MSARLAEVEFADEGGFRLEPEYGGRGTLEQSFAALQDALVANALQDAQTLGFHPRIRQAANEAAGLAWTTGYPLLVFPGLFAEITRRELLREDRQQRIVARSEELMSGAV